MKYDGKTFVCPTCSCSLVNISDEMVCPNCVVKRLGLATTFQFSDGKHIQCFFSSAADPGKPDYLSPDGEREPGWYVFDNDHDRILATDGTWPPDSDGWDARHRFATMDEAFAAIERQP